MGEIDPADPKYAEAAGVDPRIIDPEVRQLLGSLDHLIKNPNTSVPVDVEEFTRAAMDRELRRLTDPENP